MLKHLAIVALAFPAALAASASSARAQHVHKPQEGPPVEPDSEVPS